MPPSSSAWLCIPPRSGSLSTACSRRICYKLLNAQRALHSATSVITSAVAQMRMGVRSQEHCISYVAATPSVHMGIGAGGNALT